MAYGRDTGGTLEEEDGEGQMEEFYHLQNGKKRMYSQ